MLDQHKHQRPIHDTGSQVSSESLEQSLSEWIRQNTGIELARIGSRFKGNDLHILVEDFSCPAAAVVLPVLKHCLTSLALRQIMVPGSAQVYRVIVYGREMGSKRPTWTEAFYLNQPTSTEPDTIAPPEKLSPAHFSTVEMLTTGSMTQWAKTGRPDAIARYLSHRLSEMGIAVKAKTETTTPRLLITCESAYSPDPLILAEPVAQSLRELELEGFKDALVFGQVSGERRPEWMLRVDLTPTREILQTWARWGDVQAIAALLGQHLLPHYIHVSALLKDTTLHLTCVAIPTATPDKLTTLTAIAPVLSTLKPQGITGATLYGVAESTTDPTHIPTPEWIHWLDLPAATQPDLAPLTLTLAQQGNLEAIAFLLTRLLNPNIDWTLATGGVRVQVRQKGDLLHIMTDAPTCPQQSQVAVAVARFLKPLQMEGVAGIRVYGRRAGQKRPLWSYGADFTPRDRLVPEATPEFAASDAYVNDLLAPPGALVLRSELPPTDWRSVMMRWLEPILETTQQWLIKTQLFVPDDTNQLNTALTPEVVPPPNPAPSHWRVALVWGTVGLLLVVQTDWLLGQMLRPAARKVATPPTPAVSPSVAAPPALPEVTLKRKQSAEGFNSSGFTQPGTKTASQLRSEAKSELADNGADHSDLSASPLQPKLDLAAAQSSSYPTFNSRQLDEKMALYQQYLTEHDAAPDVLIIGSSRAMRGIDPVALKEFLAEQGHRGVSVFNFGINGATAQVADFVLRQVLPQDKLPKLIIFADGARAFNSGRPDVTFNGIVASEGYRSLVAGKAPIPGAVAQTFPPSENQPLNAPAAAGIPQLLAGQYKEANRRLDRQMGVFSQLYAQRDRLKTALRDQFVALLPRGDFLTALDKSWTSSDLSNATSPAAAAANSPMSGSESGLIDVDGFLPLSVRFNPVTYYQKYSRVTGDYDSDYASFDLTGKQMEAMVAMAQYAKQRQVPFVFVNLPLTTDYLDPTRKRYEDAFQQQMLSLSSQMGFTYRDLVLSLATQPHYFSDPSHLNRYGAYEVSRLLAEDIMIPWQQTR